MLSVLPSPEAEWNTDPRVYIYWARKDENGNPGSMRLSSFSHVENSGGRSSRGNYGTERVLWIDSDGIPEVDNEQYSAKGVLWHYGGQLTWGPDGMIYLTLGDKQRADWAPMADKYSACILRLYRNGTIPEGNLPTSVKPPECWAHGVRNGFRSYWDLQPAGKERFFIAEVGGNNPWTAYEDLHLGAAGKHLGWPACEGPCSNNPSYGTCSCQLHDDPIFTYHHQGNGACIVGGFVYRGTQFPPQYRGAYFFAEYAYKNMQVLHFNEDGGEVVTSSEIFQSNSGKAIVHMSEAPDGSLWYISDTGTTWNIRRVRYVAGVNEAPVIHGLGASAVSGPAPLNVLFTPHVVDPDTHHGELVYTWDFGDGTSSRGTTPSHTYTSDGNYYAVLTVSDGNSVTQSEFVFIQVGTPPVITLSGVSPEALANGIQVISGQEIHFEAAATDAGDGDLSTKLRWYEVFVHDNHTHPQGDEVLGPSYDLIVPSAGHTFEGHTGVRLSVEAVNSRGLRTVSRPCGKHPTDRLD